MSGEQLEREAREGMEALVREEIAERRESGDRLLEELVRLRRVLQGEQAKVAAGHSPTGVPPPADGAPARRRHWWQK